MVNKEFQVEGEYTRIYVPGECRMGVSYSLGWGITEFQRNGEVGGDICPGPLFLNPFPLPFPISNTINFQPDCESLPQQLASTHLS